MSTEGIWLTLENLNLRIWKYETVCNIWDINHCKWNNRNSDVYDEWLQWDYYSLIEDMPSYFRKATLEEIIKHFK